MAQTSGPLVPVQVVDSVGSAWDLGERGWSTVDCNGVSGRPYLTDQDFETVCRIHGPIVVTQYGSTIGRSA